eukprot:COSAG02_NODE_211_length_28730_cov_5.599490_21_plen_474_part_00
MKRTETALRRVAAAAAGCRQSSLRGRLHRSHVGVQTRAMFGGGGAAGPCDGASAPGRDWFSNLFQFSERKDNRVVRSELTDLHKFLEVEEQPDGLVLRSKISGHGYAIGRFDCPSLAQLRADPVVAVAKARGGKLRLSIQRGDVAEIHADPSNATATFQAASQFNCLEFVGPAVVPEDGVTGYSSDRTQGPACSIACGPATVYRNYFVRNNGLPEGQVGQTAAAMIDNLDDLNRALGNEDGRMMKVQGGYTLASDAGLDALRGVIETQDREHLKGLLKVGVHSDVEVTASGWGTRPVGRASFDDPPGPGHRVTQVFASACSVNYSRNRPQLWQPFAQLVLEATYEATLMAAAKEAEKHRYKGASAIVYLTLVGGGASNLLPCAYSLLQIPDTHQRPAVPLSSIWMQCKLKLTESFANGAGVFGNEMQWITESIYKACLAMQGCPLDVRIVNYGDYVDPALQVLEREVDMLSSM